MNPPVAIEARAESKALVDGPVFGWLNPTLAMRPTVR